MCSNNIESIFLWRVNLFIYLSFSFSVTEPDAATIRVRNLSEMILITSKPDQYNYFVSWEMPFFNESKVNEYVITCSLSGNPDRAKRWQITTVVHIDFVVSALFLSFWPFSLSFSSSRISTVDRALYCWPGSGGFDSDFEAWLILRLTTWSGGPVSSRRRQKHCPRPTSTFINCKNFDTHQIKCIHFNCFRLILFKTVLLLFSFGNERLNLNACVAAKATTFNSVSYM